MRRFIAAACVLGQFVCLPAIFADDAPAPRSVTIDVVIASGPPEAGGGEMTPAALLEFEKGGKLRWLTRMRLATIENDKARVQVGEHSPVVTGRTSRGFGGEGSQNMTVTVNVGTTVEVIPKIDDDGSIVIALTAEKTWLEPAEPAEGKDGAPPLPSHRTHTLTAKATIRVQPGEPTLVAAQSSDGKDGSQAWIVLTAKPAAPLTRPDAAAAAGPGLEVKILRLKYASAADMARLLSQVFEREPLRIAADERTNSLLVQGRPERLITAEALVQRLDEERSAK